MITPEHISYYLDFNPHPASKGLIYDHLDVAYLPSGSHINRKEDRKGRHFQLFLKKKEVLEGLF